MDDAKLEDGTVLNIDAFCASLLSRLQDNQITHEELVSLVKDILLHELTKDDEVSNYTITNTPNGKI